MAYETPLKIADVMKEISNNRYVLPAIQREFVWNTNQIEKLFDSIMRDYPIGGFLFWELPKSKYTSYHFYSFLKNYHEKAASHNSPIDLKGNDYTMAILDGQQRLTSLYIGLKGTYAYKLPNKRKANDDAYPERKLYLNLVEKAPDDSENLYDFRFLTSYEVVKDSHHYWFEVGSVLEMPNLADVNKYINRNIYKDSRYDEDQGDFATDVISKLYNVIWTEPSLSYYKVKTEELDRVLNIFIRVNSGGTKLSYSDLLLSIATAEWTHYDARKEIINLVEELNDIGDGFKVDKDFVLKASLVLSDFGNIAFKVDNFNTENMLKIEGHWDTIKLSLKQAFELVSSFGFNGDSLRSNNAVIPIAYYLMTIGNPGSFADSYSFTESRRKIKTWLIRALLKRNFSGQPDNVLRPLRRVIKENGINDFPLEQIIDEFKGGSKTLSFTDDDINELLSLSYKNKPDILIALMLLYPSLDYRNKFDIDHMYPKSKFTKRNLLKCGVPDYKIDKYIELVDNIANLQLLNETNNKEKSATDFDTWFNINYPTDESKAQYSIVNHLPPNLPFTYENFESFIGRRRLLIDRKFRTILGLQLP